MTLMCTRELFEGFAYFKSTNDHGTPPIVSFIVHPHTSLTGRTARHNGLTR